MMSTSGRPGPMGGSWLGSPTRIRRFTLFKSKARNRTPIKSIGIMDASSMITVGAPCCSPPWSFNAKLSGLSHLWRIKN